MVEVKLAKIFSDMEVEGIRYDYSRAVRLMLNEKV
jgi:hypothetical protein